MKQAIVCFLAGLFGLAGCQPTPYQKLGTDSSGGYSEKRIDRDTFFIRFTGNGNVPPATLRRYLYRRAAEVALKNGFACYAVVQPPRYASTILVGYANEDEWKDAKKPSTRELPDLTTMMMTVQCFATPPDRQGIEVVDAKHFLN